jgi:hypothetical protein
MLIQAGLLRISTPDALAQRSEGMLEAVSQVRMNLVNEFNL